MRATAKKIKMYRKKQTLPKNFNMSEFVKYIESYIIDNGHAINVTIERRLFKWSYVNNKKEQPLFSLTDTYIHELEQGYIVLVRLTRYKGQIEWTRDIIDWPIYEFANLKKRGVK